MGILLAFAVGYVVGARSGAEGYREVVDSLKAVRDSEEFHAFLRAMRSHASFTLQDLGVRLGDGADQPLTMQDVLDRVRGFVQPAEAPRAGAS